MLAFSILLLALAIYAVGGGKKKPKRRRAARTSHSAADIKWGNLQQDIIQAVKSGNSQLFKTRNLEMVLQLLNEKRPCNIAIMSLASAWYLEFDETFPTSNAPLSQLLKDWIRMATVIQSEGKISTGDFHKFLLKGFGSAKAGFGRITSTELALKVFLLQGDEQSNAS